MSPDFATDTLNGIVHGLIGLSNRGCNLSAAAAIQIQIQHADLQFGKLTAYLIQQCRSLFSVNKQILRIELTVLCLPARDARITEHRRLRMQTSAKV